MKIVLKDNTTYSVEDCSNEKAMVMAKELSEVPTIRSKLTNDNLSKFKYTQDDGTLLSEWENKKYDHLEEVESGKYKFYLADVNMAEKKADEALTKANENSDSIMEMNDILIMSTMTSMSE